jgi:hypothetical protein
MLSSMAQIRLVPSALVLCFAVAGAAPLGSRQAPQSPTFRAGTDLVTLDFLAVSSSGEPIRDLRPDEVTVRVNSRERPVRSLQFVSLDQPAGGAAGEPADDLPPAFGTNSAAEQGRAVLLLLDDDSIGPGDELRVRESVDMFLDALAPTDKVALMTAPFGVVKVNFTTERGRITQSLAQIIGRAPARMTPNDFGCRTRQTLESINGAIRSFVRGAGLPVVVVLSGGLMEPRREVGRIGGASAASGFERPIGAPDPCDVMHDDYKKLRETAANSGLHFFVARADRRNAPPTIDDGAGRSTNLVAGLEHLASALNAPLINLSGSDGSPLLRVARRTGGYYMLGFEPDAADRTGEHRTLELRTSRAGATLQWPAMVMVPRPALKASGTTSTARDLLRVGTVFRDLPMRATAVVSREKSGNTLRIVGLGEPADRTVTIASGAIGLVDSNGRLAGEWTLDGNAAPPARLMAAFAGPGGSYRLRVAAVDDRGRAGTADYEFTAELTRAGTLRLGDIMLGVARESGFAPVLAFSTEAVAAVYLELYGATKESVVRAAFDIAESINGPALRSQAAVFAATDEPDKFVATAVLPIGTLPPGDYVVRAAVALENQAATRVVRALRKIAK